MATAPLPPLPPLLRTARDAATFFEPFFAGDRTERILVAHLDAQRRLLKLIEEGSGGEAHVDIPVRAIIADAIRIDAAGMLVAHSHPSGDPRPSEVDIAATRKLAALASGLGIAFHDHLIFAGGECRSLRALGLI